MGATARPRRPPPVCSRTRGGRASGVSRSDAHPPERPDHADREMDEKEVPHRVEDGEEVDESEERSVKDDDDERRPRLVVDEPREPELELRNPVVEDVLAV